MNDKSAQGVRPHVVYRSMGGIKYVALIAATMEELGVTVISITNVGTTTSFFAIFGKIRCIEEKLASIEAAIDARIEELKAEQKKRERREVKATIV